MGPRGALDTQDDSAWDFYYQAVLMSVVRTARAVVPHLVAVGGGALVTTAAYSIRAPKPDMAHYSAMKNAVATSPRLPEAMRLPNRRGPMMPPMPVPTA